MYTSYYANKQQAIAGKDPKLSIPSSAIVDDQHSRPNVPRRTVDYMTPTVKMIQNRSFVRGAKDAKGLQPTAASSLDLLPPAAYPHLPASSFNTKFVHVSQNKVRCAINVVQWTPEGRRCMTGTASGEFTLWSGTTFNFESILQAHEFGVRAMRFSHNEHYLVSGDDNGRIKYWKPNLELLNDAVAHREAVRGICFSPTDLKFCTCSDDATLKIWDFGTCQVDKIMSGHGADAKFVDWHLSKALIASCSKDTQVKLWSAKDGECVATMYGHKAGISQVWWNRNGNWLLTAGRDQVCKLFDVRMMKEFANFRGHSREVTCCEWHPVHEELFVSGASDGSLIHWMVSRPEAQAKLTNAHDTAIWSLSWHPLGHLLATGSSDYVTKFWCRQRSGDIWRDRHLQDLEESNPRDSNSFAKIPGVGVASEAPAMIPGIEDIGAGTRSQSYVAFPGGRIVTAPRPPPGPPPSRQMLNDRQGKKSIWVGGNSVPIDRIPKRPRQEATPQLDHMHKQSRQSMADASDWRTLTDNQTNSTQFKDIPAVKEWDEPMEDYDDDAVMVGSITRRFSASGDVGPIISSIQSSGIPDARTKPVDRDSGRWERGGGRTGSGGRSLGFAGLHGKGRGPWTS